MLDTDYNNFAVIYGCNDWGKDYSNEYVWVLARDPLLIRTDEQSQKRIMAALEKVPAYDIYEDGQVTPQFPKFDCSYDLSPIPHLYTQ